MFMHFVGILDTPILGFNRYMDFLKEIGTSKLYTFHSHTEFCDGRAQMEAFAREAVKRGFTHYGFTPHSPVPIESPCNMRAADVARYFAEVERIRLTYGDSCRFYAGMEIDYLGDDWGPASPYFASLPLDYTIGSVHFIRSQEGELVDIDGHYDAFRGKMKRYFHDDIDYVVDAFFEASHRMLDAGGLDIVGHLDKIGHNAGHYREGIENEPHYRALADGLVDHIIAVAAGNGATQRPLTVEINTKAYADHNCRIFPSERLVKVLKEAGVPMIVNSDAHVPALIDASRPYGLSLLLQ